jgi:ATP-dependent Lon protease
LRERAADSPTGRAANVLRAMWDMPTRAGVAVTGATGVGGKLCAVSNYRKKTRGAASEGTKVVIVPSASIDERGHLLEWSEDPETRKWSLTPVRLERSVREGVRVVAADNTLDVIDLCLVPPGLPGTAVGQVPSRQGRLDRPRGNNTSAYSVGVIEG